MALRAFDIAHLPTPKDERWKYTNIARVMPAGLRAAAPQEMVIHIPRGQICEQAREILWTAAAGAEAKPQLRVVLEEGASLTLIERFEGTGEYWTNMIAEIALGANARLRHVRLQGESDAALHTTQSHISLARDCVYEAFSLNDGARLYRHDLHAVLQGPGATCTMNGLQLLDGARHGDTTILIEHQAPHCASNQFYRSLLRDQSRGVFQGKVHVHRPAQKTDAYQLSNALLLSPRAEMDTKPELEIYADDVKCSHGTTTGALDETPLFYLRSRGLSEAQARQLLLQAFVDEVVDKLGDEALITPVKERVLSWLSSGQA